MAYFSHDEGARNDPKLVKVLMRLGQAGKGVYWDLVEMLYEQGGYLPLAEVESYAFALRTDPELVTKLLNDFGLFKQDAERFWSESVLDRMHLRAASSSRRAAAGSKGGKARAEREALAKAALEQSLSPALAMLENPEALLNDFQAIKGKEIKGKESKEPLPSVEDAASAAAPAAVEEVLAEPLPESPATELRTPGGAADVGTRIEVGHEADIPDKTDTPTFTVTKGGRPTVADVLGYMTSQRPYNPPAALSQLAEKWHAHYSANGWKVGKNPMKDWQAACRTWLADVPKFQPGQQAANPQQHAAPRQTFVGQQHGAAARLQTPTPDASSANAWGLPAYTPPGPAGVAAGH